MAKRKALGKGLAALIPDANKIDNADEQFFQCPIDEIEPNPDQPRQSFLTNDLVEMANSIREKGVITPLIVTRTETGYQLIAGERRWRAAQKAGLQRVPVVVRDATPAESLELALIENIHRKDLNPIEEAQAYKKLMSDLGATQDTVAKKIGKDRTTITNLLRLLNLPVKIQKDLIDGNLSMGHARVLAGIKNRGTQKSLRDLVLKKGLSVRQLEDLVKKKNKSRKARKKDSVPDDYIQSLSDNLKRSLGTKVDINRKGREGKIVIYFYSDDELGRLLDLLQ